MSDVTPTKECIDLTITSDDCDSADEEYETTTPDRPHSPLTVFTDPATKCLFAQPIPEGFESDYETDNEGDIPDGYGADDNASPEKEFTYDEKAKGSYRPPDSIESYTTSPLASKNVSKKNILPADRKRRTRPVDRLDKYVLASTKECADNQSASEISETDCPATPPPKRRRRKVIVISPSEEGSQPVFVPDTPSPKKSYPVTPPPTDSQFQSIALSPSSDDEDCPMTPPTTLPANPSLHTPPPTYRPTAPFNPVGALYASHPVYMAAIDHCFDALEDAKSADAEKAFDDVCMAIHRVEGVLFFHNEYEAHSAEACHLSDLRMVARRLYDDAKKPE